MNYLSVENVDKSFSDKELFRGLTFGIDKGQKVAFIARNGAGKTTLLNILTGSDTPDAGLVVWRNDLRVGYLSQNPVFDLDDTVLDAVFSDSGPITQAVKTYEEALLKSDAQEELQDAFELMDNLQAWDYESRVKTILSTLGLERLDQKVGTLSGGQKKRVALARVLIGEPQFIILDEPTNHLDMQMIEWLENYLASDQVTLFMVTHDRYFLDRVCNVILELDQKELHRYNGNYAYFLEKQAERHQVEGATVGKARSLMKKELEWVRRQPKARGTKAKSRLDAFDVLKEKASKRIDDRALQPEINSTRLGTKIIECHKVSKGYPDLMLIKNFEYTFQRFERVGIVGKNGAGKTTFLNLITGKDTPDTGKVVIGETVQFGYYTQSGMNINQDQRVIEVIKDIAEYLPMAKGKKLSASQLLERFLFPRDTQYNYVHKLSGGEQKRLFLLTILMGNPNFLILDEPTNDLDIVSLNVLEDFLQEFGGCLVVVSHDRFFIDKMVDHLFAFEGDGSIKDFPGNYSQYRDWKANQATESKAEVVKKDKPKQTIKEKKRLSYKEKFEFEQLGGQLEKLEAKKIELTELLNSGISDHEELLNTGDQLGKIVSELETKEMRWLELSELV